MIETVQMDGTAWKKWTILACNVPDGRVHTNRHTTTMHIHTCIAQHVCIHARGACVNEILPSHS